MTNPYFIDGPALISFSGGRTSGFMLHEILKAHDGKLPENIVVAFANTGKEREETLRFVHECGTRWNVDIAWLQWCSGADFELVGFNSAARKGEPFEELIKAKVSYLPNWQARFCTQHLKVQVLGAYAASLGFVTGQYADVIGLRYDEGHRILKGMENAEKYGRKCLYPLSKARVTKSDVLAFWKAQPFDLGLEPWEGNCDLCFLKGLPIRRRIIRDNPRAADWWVEQERLIDARFDNHHSYASLVEEVRRTPMLFDAMEEEEYDVECGLHCAPGEEDA